jgi:hypothetical protein
MACVLLLGAAAPPMTFVPVQPGWAQAAEEYARIWKSDGARIAASLEAVSGLRFPATKIDAIVSEARPMTSYDGRVIRLRAGYSADYKKATLVHELGHRLALTLGHRDGLDDHRLLYLFLHDAWADLYGRDFADRMVAIERRIPGGYDYDSAWTWALSLDRAQRQERLRRVRGEPGAPGRMESMKGFGRPTETPNLRSGT